MNIFNLIGNITKLISQSILPLSCVDLTLMNHLQLLRPTESSPKMIKDRFIAFANNDVAMLEFKVKSASGVYIKLYRKNIEIKNGLLKLLDPSAVAIYHRGRYPGETNAKTELVGYLTKTIGTKLNQHIKAYQHLKAKCRGTNSLSVPPTLEDFLSTYENILYLHNPDTVHRKINLIKSKFPHLLCYPIDEIKGKQLIDFVGSYKRKRTAAQVQNEESPYTVKESTIKDWVCTLRGAIKAASSYTGLFECYESLWDKALKFKIDNESDKYLSDEELETLIESLKDRDDKKLQGKSSSCQFADYLAPLILTCLATGLRPTYALALKWSDIDEVNMLLRIRGTKGKIKETEYCELTQDFQALLAEWKKHTCHKLPGNWLFPSPAKPGCHIVSFKTAFTSFRENYGLDFVLYDTRHTFATLITKIYKNIQTTQAMLHHKDRKSTQRYSRVIKTSKTDAANEFSEKYSFFSKYGNEAIGVSA